MDLVHYSDGSTEDIDERYSTAIWAYQQAHGCTVMDMAPEQLERYLAWRIVHDVVRALDLILERRARANEVRP